MGSDRPEETADLQLQGVPSEPMDLLRDSSERLRRSAESMQQAAQGGAELEEGLNRAERKVGFVLNEEPPGEEDPIH